MVILYNRCVEGRELASWLFYTTRLWKGGSLYHDVSIHYVCGKALASCLLYTTRLLKGGSWYHGYCTQPLCGMQ